MGIHATPRIDNFDHAKRLWADTPPWRGDSTPNVRPLATRRDKHITIRSTDDPDSPVHCRLYTTDCVTFHADGIVEIRGYPSKSTVDFIRNILSGYVDPLRLCAAYLVDGGRVVCGPDIAIRLPDTYKQPVEVGKAEPFRFYSLDRKKVNAWLKSLRWQEFRTWALAAYDILDGRTGRKQLYAAAEEAFPEVCAELARSPIWRRDDASAAEWVADVRRAIVRYNRYKLRTMEQLLYCKDEKEYRRKVRATEKVN